MATGTVFNVTASMGRMGPNSALEAGIEAGIRLANNRAAAGDNRGQVEMSQPTRNTNYYTYCWQALFFASILIAFPILIYGCWAASGFLVRNTSFFGWAWIICSLISFCTALYFEPTPAPSDGVLQLRICPFALTPGAQVALASSSDADTPEFNSTRLPAPVGSNEPIPSTSAGPRAQVQVQPLSASVKRLPQSTTASTRAQSQIPVAVSVPASNMNSNQQMKQGQIFGASKTNTGGAQLLTSVGTVFNEDPGSTAALA